MKFFFILLFCLILNTVPALAGDLNFSYSYDATPSPAFNLELYELSKVFEEKNFDRLSGFPSGDLPYIHADEVMSSPYRKGEIFIKTKLVAPANLRYQIIEGKGFYLYHTDTASIAFFDFNRGEVAELIEGLPKRKTAATQFFSMFISTAAAADTVVPCNLKAERNAFAGIEAVGEKISNSALMKRIGECGVTALKGAEDQVTSTLTSARDFFMMLKDNPTKLWTNMKESYQKFKEFISNFSSEIQKFYSAVSGLSLDDALDIACTLTGQAVPQVAMMLTGVGIGAGMSRIMVTLAPKMTRLTSLLNKFKRHKIPIDAAKESLSCGI